MSFLKKIFKKKENKEKKQTSIDEIIVHFDQEPTSPKSENSIGHVPYDAISIYCSQLDQAKNSDSDEIKCLIYFSYCWFDEELAHQIAKKMSEHGLNVLFDKDKMSMDASNAIFKCDIIVLCISKSYMSCDACLKEAYFSFSQYIPIIPISVVKGFKPDLWLAQIIAGKRHKLLTTDLDKFVYNPTKDNIFSTLKILSSKLIEKKKIKFKEYSYTKEQLTVQIKNFNSKFQNQILKEKNLIDKNKIHIEKVFDDLVNDEDKFKQEFTCVYRWLKKYPNVTVFNFKPFTPTGDINDAVFVLAEEAKANFEKKLHMSISCGTQPTILSKRTVNLCLIAKANQLNRPKDESKVDSTTKFFMKLIKRSWRFKTSLASGTLAWETIENRDFNSQPCRSFSEMQRRKKLDTDLSMGKKRRVQLSNYFKSDTNRFCIFAKKMLDNLIEFEKFCNTNSDNEQRELIGERHEKKNSIAADLRDKEENVVEIVEKEVEKNEIDCVNEEEFITAFGIMTLEENTIEIKNDALSKIQEKKCDNLILIDINDELNSSKGKLNENLMPKISPIPFKTNHPILNYEPIFFMLEFFYK